MTTGSREPESGGVRTPPLFPFFLFFFCPFFRWNLGPHCRFFPPPRYTVLNSTSISGEVSCSAHSGRFSADSVSPLKEFISAGTFVISSSFFFFATFLPEGVNPITAQHQGEGGKQKLQKSSNTETTTSLNVVTCGF